MDDSDGYERDEIDDIIDGSGTDTSLSRSSTASSIASSTLEKQKFVIELHELQKDDPTIKKQSDCKFKKHKKMKGAAVKEGTTSSDSSETENASLSPSLTDEITPEQFFDAHESFYDFSGTVGDRILQDIEKLPGMKLFLERPEMDRHASVPLIEDLKPVSDNLDEPRNLSGLTESQKDTKEQEVESCNTVPIAEVPERKETKDPPMERFTLQPSPPFTNRPADRRSPVNASEQTTVEIKLLKEQAVGVPSLPTSMDQIAPCPKILN